MSDTNSVCGLDLTHGLDPAVQGPDLIQMHGSSDRVN